MLEIVSFLESNSIEFTKVDHKAVFTCEEAEQHVPPLPGLKLKNILLESESKSFFLIVSLAGKRLDYKKLAKLLGCKKLKMSKPETLKELLNVDPGSVSILALKSDINNKIKCVMDNEVWEGGFIQSHPLVNTSTLCIPINGIEKFLAMLGKEIELVQLPYQV